MPHRQSTQLHSRTPPTDLINQVAGDGSANNAGVRFWRIPEASAELTKVGSREGKAPPHQDAGAPDIMVCQSGSARYDVDHATREA